MLFMALSNVSLIALQLDGGSTPIAKTDDVFDCLADFRDEVDPFRLAKVSRGGAIDEA